MISKEFVDQLTSQTPLSRVLGKYVKWDTRKSNTLRGEMWACCPFHQEKTPSFKADDRNGLYYCFGCHKGGGIISFYKDYHHLDFTQAIQRLADDLGVEVPKSAIKKQSKVDSEKFLTDLLAKVAAAWHETLMSGAKAAARNYCYERGLTEQTLIEFQLGLADESTKLSALAEFNRFDEKHLSEVGLLRHSTRDQSRYPHFRDRLIFPVCNTRGQTIAFGGRALKQDIPAKYINSTASSVFNKSHSLFNIHRAIKFAGKAQGHTPKALIVVEGYMDVVQLYQSGFKATVAPMGTALGQAQLRLLWRTHPNPTIVMDGDTAGHRSMRMIAETALPLMQPHQQLSFVVLPENHDPDDIIRNQGIQAFQQLLQTALPLFDFLFYSQQQNQKIDSIHDRASFEKSLLALCDSIQDEVLKKHARHYFTEQCNRLFAMSASPPQAFQRYPGQTFVKPTKADTYKTALATKSRQNAQSKRLLSQTQIAKPWAASETNGSFVNRQHVENQLLMYFLRAPTLIAKYVADLEQCEFESPLLKAVIHTLLELSIDHSQLSTIEFYDKLQQKIDNATKRTLASVKQLRDSSPHQGISFYDLCIKESLGFLKAEAEIGDLKRQLAEINSQATNNPDDSVFSRLVKQLEQAQKSRIEALTFFKSNHKEIDQLWQGTRGHQNSENGGQSSLAKSLSALGETINKNRK